MDLKFSIDLSKKYTSNSQISRILTENWVKNNAYCPVCGYENLNQFVNNSPVADFLCIKCDAEFELKSKNGGLSNKIVDGAYATMIERILSENNPNFFFLTYNKTDWSVKDFLIIPKHYFIPHCIEMRKPLSPTAKRAGWTGCNILLDRIPTAGRIFIINNSKIIEKSNVIKKWKDTEFLSNLNLKSKGWLVDTLNCIDLVCGEGGSFRLDDIYRFEDDFKIKYPKNNFIKEKLRQQLQILRDRDFLEFTGKGTYKRIVK